MHNQLVPSILRTPIHRVKTLHQPPTREQGIQPGQRGNGDSPDAPIAGLHAPLRTLPPRVEDLDRRPLTDNPETLARVVGK